MTLALLAIAYAFAASNLLLLDSAIKGGAILVLATFVVMMLWRDLAATRHLVWLVAIVAVLVVPAFSATPAAADDVKPPAEAAKATSAEKTLQDKEARELFKIWQGNARTDGKIPGALIGRLGEMVKYFIELNEGEGEGGKMSIKFEQLLPRFVSTRDWTQADAITLLDEVSAIHSIPLRNTLDGSAERVILAGDPLPAELTDAPWGTPAANGLRAAWLLEPRAKEYPLGTSLRSRILVHNSGKETVFFIMPSWQQTSKHKARDANDAAIKVSSTYWTTMARMTIYRLAPGAYCETLAPGVGVGTKAADEDWANIRPGAWVEAKEGDDIRFTPGAVEVRMSPQAVGMRYLNRFQNPKDAADLWKTFVAERIERELPIPTGAADREQLLRRVVLDLYGVAPDESEIKAFVADKSHAATHPIASRDLLAIRVQEKRSVSPFTGTLPSGEISFRVLAADPDAATRPRAATGPGYYILGDKQRLHIEQTREGHRRVNKATIRFFTAKRKTDPAAAPYKISLPEGRLTFAIAWERGANVLWISQKGLRRKYDFTNHAQVKETRFTEPYHDKMPMPIFDAIRAALDVPGAPVQQQETLKPKDGT